MKIKCTYENCFKHFATKEAMITHKKKDPTHSYCARCDVDCADDMLLFIHQLGSSAHICCPVCAQEFKSPSGRDIHVEAQHRASQKINCAGCGITFPSASSLMSHIERDECSIIRHSDFQIQRAEKQLRKDAWETQTDSVSVVQSARENASTAYNSNIFDTQQNQDTMVNAAAGHISVASHNEFPSLLTKPPNDNQHQYQTSALGNKTSSNLIDFDESLVKSMGGIKISHDAIVQRHTEQTAQNGNSGSVNKWLDAVNSTSSPPSDKHSEGASIYNKTTTASAVSENIPPAAQAQPNLEAPTRHIINMPAHTIIASNAPVDVERFWDHVQQAYTCPTQKCRRLYSSVNDFRQHLLTSAHAGGKVVCPSCLKSFASTTAWVAHTESASRRCDIRNSVHFNRVMREITGGVLGTHGFMDDGTVKFVAPKIEDWSRDEEL